MRVCLQRVSQAAVHVNGELVGEIGRGLLALVGVAEGDTEDDARRLAGKVVGLRVFDDEAGKMNRSVVEVGGAVLVVSQFTLLGDCRKGRRPSFIGAASPELGERLYELFAREIAAQSVPVATGRFRANMQVSLVNDGPVTLVFDSAL